MAIRVEASIPPTTVEPRILRETAPDPVAIASGTQPRMKAKAVMRMGLSLSLAASSAASMTGRPFSTSSLANSTIRMAFLAARPMSMMSPIWA